MSRAIRRLITDLVNGVSAPSVPSPAGPGPTGVVPSTPAPPARKGLPGSQQAAPPSPPARVPPQPPAPGNGWRTAARVGMAVAAGGGLLGAIGALTGGGGGAQPPQPPAPPPPPPQPPIDPKTATKEQLLAAGYRDYGSGFVPPGSNAMGVPDHWRRKMFLKQQANRYRQEFAKNPEQYSDMVAAYDQVPGGSHSARAVATRALTDHLDAQKAAQIGINVDNAAKQTNIARQMGVPRGYVMAMDDVAASAAKGNLAEASAKAAMYGQVYGQSFLYGARNLTDQHVASEKAKAEQKPPQPGVVETVNKNMAEINALPPGPARKAAIENFYRTANGGAQADPKAVEQAVRNHYQTIIKDMGGRLGSLSPEELSELQQVAGNMSYQQFMQYTGLPDTVDNQKHYQRIFGKNASYAQWGDNLGFGIGNAIRGLTPWAD